MTACGRACAALATSSALAGGVRPDTTRAGTSIPLRVTAVLRTARRLREVEVATAGPTSESNAVLLDVFPAHLRVFGKRSRCAPAEDAIVIARLDLAGS